MSVALTYTDVTTGKLVYVDSSHPLPTTGGGGGSTVVTNAGTFAVQNTAATPAGSAIIGKVGTDQTTPGTTDLVTSRYTRPNNMTGSFALGTAYAVKQNIGGLQTISGLVPNQPYRLSSASFVFQGTLTALASAFLTVFSGAPVTTFANGVDATVNVSDVTKIVYQSVGIGLQSISTNCSAGTLIINEGKMVTADGSGNIYFTLTASGTFTLVGATLGYLFDIRS